MTNNVFELFRGIGIIELHHLVNGTITPPFSLRTLGVNIFCQHTDNAHNPS